MSKLPNNSSSASLILTVLLPYQHRTLILFVTSLAAQIKPQSINVYLDGGHSLHVSNGYNNPLTPGLQLKQTLCGIDRNNFAAPKQKMPVTFDLLCKIHPFMNFHSNYDIVYNYLWPFLVMGSSCYATRSTLTPHAISHSVTSLLISPPGSQHYWMVPIKQLNTDQRHRGVTLYVSHTPFSLPSLRNEI